MREHGIEPGLPGPNPNVSSSIPYRYFVSKMLHKWFNKTPSNAGIFTTFTCIGIKIVIRDPLHQQR